MMLGQSIEMRSIGKVQRALHELARLLPDMAVRVAEDRNRDGHDRGGRINAQALALLEL